MIDSITNFINENILFNDLIIIVVVLLLSAFSYFLTKRVLIKILEQIIKRSKNKLDDLFLANFHYTRIAYLAPLLILNYSTTYLPESYNFINTILFICISLILLSIVGSVLDAINEIYNTFKFEKAKPIKGYIQLIKIFVYIIGSVFIFAIMTDKSPWALLSGIGAFTAILLLIFRDTILSFVASLQINSNDLIRIGDWIEVPKYGADGDVIDIALHTIKIQNWDKTITTIPTHKIIDESFKNYRAMIQSGGRRIKRAIHIDIESIRFLTKEDIEKFKGFEALKPYLDKKEKELAEKNKKYSSADKLRLTNIGTFRAYLQFYLESHPNINKTMTLLVRQLESTPHGIPIQIYVFTNTTEWAKYEDIQSDIFDHVFAILNMFDLKFFQTILTQEK